MEQAQERHARYAVRAFKAGDEARFVSTGLEKSMAHFHSAIDARPVADRARARRNTFHKVLNGALFTAAFLFVVAVVCGLLP